MGCGDHIAFSLFLSGRWRPLLAHGVEGWKHYIGDSLLPIGLQQHRKCGGCIASLMFLPVQQGCHPILLLPDSLIFSFHGLQFSVQILPAPMGHRPLFLLLMLLYSRVEHQTCRRAFSVAPGFAIFLKVSPPLSFNKWV